MRNGSEIAVEGKLPAMLPYDRYTLSKIEDINPPSSLTSINIDTIIVNGKCQFGGNFPRYFWKGLVKLIKTTNLQ